MILYEADMKIPIYNTLYNKNKKFIKKRNIRIEDLNNLKFKKIDAKIFPSLHLLEKCFRLGPSTPIVINAANEVLVDMFLKGKIRFLDIVKMINRILKGKDFKKYAKRKPSSLKHVKIIDNWARLKINNMCVK